MFVPHVAMGQAPALQPYRFATLDESRWLLLGISAFAYGVIGTRYETFEVFTGAFKRYLEHFLEVYPHLPGLTRIGLRYINHLPIKRDIKGNIVESPLPLAELESEPSLIRNSLIVSELEIEEGLLRFVIDTTQSQLPKEMAVLDFDFFYQGDLSSLIDLKELDERLERAHAVTKRFLHQLVEQDYLQEVGIT